MHKPKQNLPQTHGISYKFAWVHLSTHIYTYTYNIHMYTCTSMIHIVRRWCQGLHSHKIILSLNLSPTKAGMQRISQGDYED